MLIMYMLVQIKASVAVVSFMLVEIQGNVIKAKQGMSHAL